MVRLPRGAPQALGAGVALLIFWLLAALHLRVGALSVEINWTFAVTFIGLNVVVALVSLWRRRAKSG